MKRRRGRHEANIELTPLIDVVFLLLIFFMVSTTFIQESEMNITLPQASGEVVSGDPNTIEIVVAKSGDYAVNEQVLVNTEKETLMRALQQLIDPSEPSPRLIITADASSAHQAVVRAMDAAGSVGLTRISIATQQSGEEG